MDDEDEYKSLKFEGEPDLNQAEKDKLAARAAQTIATRERERIQDDTEIDDEYNSALSLGEEAALRARVTASMRPAVKSSGDTDAMDVENLAKAATSLGGTSLSGAARVRRDMVTALLQKEQTRQAITDTDISSTELEKRPRHQTFSLRFCQRRPKYHRAGAGEPAAETV